MNKKLLIIKPDHIGDYILFFNYLKIIKNSKKFIGYNIYFLGNERIREMAEFLNDDIVYKFFWLDIGKYSQADWYTQLRNNEILENSYDTVLNLKFFAYNQLEDLIYKINSSDKICVKTISEKEQKIYTKDQEKKYNQVIDISNHKIFKFERFRLAFEKLLEETISITNPRLQIHSDFTIDSPYIVIFIGSDAKFRKWNIDNYIKVIQYILENFNVSIIITGGQSESKDGIYIQEIINNKRVLNLVNQTTTVDLLKIIANSSFIISNETGSVHISMALDIPTLVISNGNSFGKFTPYPKSYTNKYFALYPFEIKSQNDYDKYRELYYIFPSDLDINNISTKKVISNIKNLFIRFNITILKTKSNIKNTVLEPKYHLSKSQKNDNYLFSFMFSRLHHSIEKLKDINQKFIIYGNTSLSKYLLKELSDSIVCIIDKQSNDVSKVIERNKIYSLNNLKYINYNKIIISVLGRENEIMDDLVDNYQVKKSNIIIFKILKKDYVGC